MSEQTNPPANDATSKGDAAEPAPETSETAAAAPDAGAGAGAGAAEDVPPDHLAVHPWSEKFDEAVLQRGVGIKFKGTVRKNIEEYCISEGWVRVQAGKTMDRRGRPLTLKLKGEVEAWFEDLGENPPVAKAGD